jgi:hypothetical protein
MRSSERCITLTAFMTFWHIMDSEVASEVILFSKSFGAPRECAREDIKCIHLNHRTSFSKRRSGGHVVVNIINDGLPTMMVAYLKIEQGRAHFRGWNLFMAFHVVYHRIIHVMRHGFGNLHTKQ